MMNTLCTIQVYNYLPKNKHVSGISAYVSYFWNIMRQEKEFNMNNKNEDDIQRISFGMLEMEK